MAELVAIDLPGGQAFVDEVRRAWDDGDAFLPIDPRLPPPARERLLDRLVPRWIVDADGRRGSGRDAVPVEPGDAAVVPTSGTGGDPKGVVLTHDAVVAHAAAVHRAARRHGDRSLAGLPPARPRRRARRRPARARRRDRSRRRRPLRRRAGRGGADPARLDARVARPDRPRPGRAGAWRWIVLGGSADPGPRPANVVRTYGMTETGGGVVYDGTPLPGTEVRIVDGEVELRGPSLLRALPRRQRPSSPRRLAPDRRPGCDRRRRPPGRPRPGRRPDRHRRRERLARPRRGGAPRPPGGGRGRGRRRTRPRVGRRSSSPTWSRRTRRRRRRSTTSEHS